MSEGKLLHKANSETAASVGNPQFPPSGVMTYRVLTRTALGGTVPIDVDAATGDEAASKALDQVAGGFVMSVNPAPAK